MPQIVISALDKFSDPLLNMSVRLEAFNKQLGKTSQAAQAWGMFAEQMKPSLDRVNKAWTGVQQGAKVFAGFTAVVGAAGFGLVTFATSAAAAIDTVGDLAARYQVATTSVQVWGGLVEEAGGSMEDAAAGMGKLKKAMNEALTGDKTQGDAFAGIGISVARLKDMKAEDVMLAIADAFKGSTNDLAKQAVLLQLMGKNGTIYMDVMNKGAPAIRDRFREMRADGRLFSDEQIQQADNFDKAWKRATGAFDGLKNTFGLELATALLPIIDATRQWLEANKALLKNKFTTFVEYLPIILDNVVKAATIVWNIFSALATAFKLVSYALGPTATVFGVMLIALAPLIVSVISLGGALYGLGAAAVVALGPIGLAVAAVGAVFVWLASVVYDNWDGIVTYILGAWMRIKSVFDVNFFDGLMQVWLEAWQGLANGILGIIKSIPFVDQIPGLKDFKFDFADKFAVQAVAANTAGQAAEPITAAQAASTQKQQIDNTLRIKIDSEGRPRVAEMTSSSSQTRLDVSTGLVMAGG